MERREQKTNAGVGPDRGRAVRFYYGWFIAVAAFFGLILSMGTRSAFGPFLLPMIEDLVISRTALSLVVSTSMVVFALFLPVTGHVVDRQGGRPMLAGGTVLLSVGLVGTGLATSVPQLLFWYGVVAALGFAATGHVVFQAVLNRWFVRRRGMVLSLLSAGAVGGLGFMTPLAALLVDSFGWRHAIIALATALLAVLLPTALWVIKERPEDMGLRPDGDFDPNGRVTPHDAIVVQASPVAADAAGVFGAGTLGGALRSGSFWMLVGGYFTCGFSMNLLGTHGVPMLIDHGFSPMAASSALGVVGLVGIVGSVGIGVASDHFGRKDFLALIYLVRGLGFALIVLVRTPIELFLLTAAAGLVWVGSAAMTSALTADIFGRKWTGSLFGLIYLSHQIGAALGAYLGGWGYDHWATHGVAFGVAAGLLLVGAVLSHLIPENDPHHRWSPRQRLSPEDSGSAGSAG